MKSPFPSHWPPVELKSFPNQKNLRLSVKNNRILISGPKVASKQEMIQFAIQHSDWVEKVLKQKKQVEPEKPVEADEQKVYLGGKWITFEVITHPSNRITVDAQSGKLVAHLPIDVNRLLLKQIKELVYKYMAHITLPKEFHSFAQKNGFNYDRIFIRSQKTKWGTCSSKTNISFNWRLIKCPLEIRYYLYAHEASHLVHMNHSKDFWNFVEVYDPKYKEHEKWLKQHEKFLFEVD